MTFLPRVTRRGVTFVTEFEGYEPMPYWDVDHWSHGFGTPASGQYAPAVSREEAWAELRRWLNRKVVPQIPRRFRMNEWEIDACASFAYNLGAYIWVNTDVGERLRGPEGRHYADRRGIYHEEFRRFISKGTPYEEGLLRRRLAESHLARNADYSI